MGKLKFFYCLIKILFYGSRLVSPLIWTHIVIAVLGKDFDGFD